MGIGGWGRWAKSPNCPDTCRNLAVAVHGRVAACEGDPDHPFTRCFLCHKVHRHRERISSPLRVLAPMRRVRIGCHRND
ncbi:MAG: hypothetical protein V2A76_09515 [Planctomycetota bacterium]